MGKKPNTPDQFSELRKRAEALQSIEDETLAAMSDDETSKLVHELRTYQIELEMQNEELRQTQRQLILSNERYTSLYEFAPIGYITLNAKGLICEVNLTFADLLSVERKKLLATPLSRYILPDDQDIFYHHRLKIENTKQQASCQIRLMRSDNKWFWTEIKSILIEGDAGNDDQLRIAITDITERKHAEESRLSFERQILQSQKLESLGILAGGVAHDFNNLLTAILGHSQLALNILSPISPARVNLAEIKNASNRAAELANQMLAYSGQGRFVVEPIDCRECIDEIVHLLKAAISKKHSLRFEFSEEELVFEGDATQIRQILMNLLINASEAIGDHTGIITLSTGVVDSKQLSGKGFPTNQSKHHGKLEPGHAYIYFEISDTGCGMDAETLEKVFDPFFTTKFTGRGLGLSAVLGIVNGHAGALRTISEIGRGTTFRVYFPQNQLADNKPVKPKRNKTEVADLEASGTILLVDDEETVCTAGSLMLEGLGFDVLTAQDGNAAMTMYREHAENIVCVLLDLTMPFMDGFETFCQIRQINADAKIILSSGFNETSATERFAGRGLSGFVKKPYTIDRLRETLAEVLQKK